jgi:hypothetical protein
MCLDFIATLRANVLPQTGHSPDVDSSVSSYNLVRKGLSLTQGGGNDNGYSHRCEGTVF